MILDEYGRRDYRSQPDGRVIQAVGGASGNLRLINGQKIRFPWRTQEEIAGSAPPRIQSYEIDAGGQHTINLQIGGAVMDANAPTIDMAAPYPDETDEPSIDISSGSYPGSDSAVIIMRGHPTKGTIDLFGNVTLWDNLKIDSITDRIGPLVIDSSGALTLNSGGTLTLQPDANQNLALTTTGTGDINLSANGDIAVSAIRTLALSAGSGFDLTIGTSGLGIVDIANAGTVRLGAGASTITIGSTSATINLAGYQISGAWTNYTPVLSQNGTISKTVTYCRYVRLGRTVIYQGFIVATAAGTAGQVISVSLPVTAVIGSFHPVGTFYIYDAAPGTNYSGTSLNRTTTSLGFLVNQAGEVGSNPSFALANGDQIKWEVTYEAAAS